MNIKTKIVTALTLAVLVVPGISFAQTMSVAQLQAEIQSLTAQLQSLETQLATTEGSTAWCYTFNSNLSIGMTGNPVTELQTALQKDGESVTITGTFDDQTASAVTAFQEKYESQILAPYGLSYGTGYAGKATRAELNSLFGCGTTNPTPNSDSPMMYATSSTPFTIASAPVITSSTPVVTVTSASLTPNTGPAGTMATLSYQLSNADTSECATDGCVWQWWNSNGVTVQQNASMGGSGSSFQVPASSAPGQYYLSLWDAEKATAVLEAPFTIPTLGVTPPTVTVSANPTTITLGQSSTITWSSSNAAGCDPVGSWAGAADPYALNSTDGATSDNISVTPTSVGIYTYNVSCLNAGGSTTGSATLTVTATPITPAVAATTSLQINGSNGPLTVSSGASLNLVWTSAGVVSACTISVNTVGAGPLTIAQGFSGNTTVNAPTVNATNQYSYAAVCPDSARSSVISQVMVTVTP